MAKRKKTVDLLVRVSVPAGMTPSDAQREVRTLINHQSFWGSDTETGDVRAVKIRKQPDGATAAER